MTCFEKKGLENWRLGQLGLFVLAGLQSLPPLLLLRLLQEPLVVEALEICLCWECQSHPRKEEVKHRRKLITADWKTTVGKKQATIVSRR